MRSGWHSALSVSLLFITPPSLPPSLLPSPHFPLPPSTRLRQLHHVLDQRTASLGVVYVRLVLSGTDNGVSRLCSSSSSQLITSFTGVDKPRSWPRSSSLRVRSCGQQAPFITHSALLTRTDKSHKFLGLVGRPLCWWTLFIFLSALCLSLIHI